MAPMLVLPAILIALTLDPQAAPPPPAAPPTAPPQATPAPAPAAKGFAGVDLFGTTRITVEKLLEPLHDRFAEYERLSLADQFEEAAKVQHELETALKQSGGFAFLKFSMIRYFRDGDPRYLTIDVVEPADAARRMSFAKPPADATALPDPE